MKINAPVVTSTPKPLASTPPAAAASAPRTEGPVDQLVASARPALGEPAPVGAHAEVARHGAGFQLGSTKLPGVSFREIDKSPQVLPSGIADARVSADGTTLEIDVKAHGRIDDGFHLNASAMFTNFDPPKVPLFLHRDPSGSSTAPETVESTVRFDLSALKSKFGTPEGRTVSLLIGGRDLRLTL